MLAELPKIDIETLRFILQRNETDIRKIAEIMNEVELELKAEEEEKELRPPPVKKQFVMLVSDPEGLLENKDLVGWVAQIPEEDSVATAASRIHSAAEIPGSKGESVSTMNCRCVTWPAGTMRSSASSRIR